MYYIHLTLAPNNNFNANSMFQFIFNFNKHKILSTKNCISYFGESFIS